MRVDVSALKALIRLIRVIALSIRFQLGRNIVLATGLKKCKMYAIIARRVFLTYTLHVFDNRKVVSFKGGKIVIKHARARDILFYKILKDL